MSNTQQVRMRKRHHPLHPQRNLAAIGQPPARHADHAGAAHIQHAPMRDAAFAERIEYHLAKRDADVAAISDRNAGVGSARETCKALVVMDRAALVDLGEKAAAAAARLFAARAHAERSEARRVGKECVRTCLYRWSQ